MTTVLDSRRLTGPGLLLDRPGAVLDLRLNDSDHERAVIAWQGAARRLLDALGWSSERLVSRRFPGGLSLALTAPADCLYSATELNERAWEAAAAELGGQPPPDLGADVAWLRAAIAKEGNPGVIALRAEAIARGLIFLSGEDLVSVGSGSGVRVWPEGSLPAAADVDWEKIHDVPIVLVTGSNGKTTVVRLLGAMARAAGRTPGLTSTDGVTVGAASIAGGDFSGPSGARMALRRAEVDLAILETARGGMLRRGLAVGRADVAVVTNVAEDHLGEFGVETLADLADTKLLVARVLGKRGTLVLNADDPMLVERSHGVEGPITWFSLDSHSGLVESHLAAGGTAVLADADRIVLLRRGLRTTVAPLAEIPITFGGAARHNVANVLAAVAAAAALGIGVQSMGAGLRGFGQEPEDNLGRANLVDLGGIHVLIDYAHNAHGMSALVGLAQTFPARRRLVMLGQAGDRGDEAIRQLARAAWALRPDRVIVKEMDEYLRGRAPGEVPALLADEFIRLGLPDKALVRGGSEMAGLRAALQWAQTGDLLVLAVHQERQQVLEFLARLRSVSWRPGMELPELGVESLREREALEAIPPPTSGATGSPRGPVARSR